MKSTLYVFSIGLGLLLQTARAQTVDVSIIYPIAGGISGSNLLVTATASGTYDIISVVAEVDGRTVDLVWTPAAYQWQWEWMPGWTNTLSLAGLTEGTNTLTVTATDVFSNTGTAQRSFIYNDPPTITVMAPLNGVVARPALSLSASSNDDGSGTRIDVYRFVDMGNQTLLARNTNSIDCSLDLSAYDHQSITLRIVAIDSFGRTSEVRRRVYVQSSSNVVEIARTSDGAIVNTTPERILFKNLRPDYSQGLTLKTLERITGLESTVFSHTNSEVHSAFLAPDGAVFVTSGSPFEGFATGYGLYQLQDGTPIRHAVHGAPIDLICRGNYAAWGWGSGGGYHPELNLIDLTTTNSIEITNSTGADGISFDVAENGNVVFAVQYYSGTNHTICRYLDGSTTIVAQDLSNGLDHPKTDGSNVYCIRRTATNQALLLTSQSGQSIIAEGASVGPYYLLNNGWLAYELQSASGQMQVWRRSPAGAAERLSYYATSSTLAGLAPNGQTAFYNNSTLYISNGAWPPAEIAGATSNLGMSVFWQNDRWCAAIGRSLFQLCCGSPAIASPRTDSAGGLCFDIVAGIGKSVVTEDSPDLIHWTNCATNAITDLCELQVTNAASAVGMKFFRLRTQ